MIFEWYSGSDISRSVPKTIGHLAEISDETPPERMIELINQLLDKEEEPNWRGLLRFYLAGQHYEAEDNEQAIRCYKDALSDFNPYLSSFSDVRLQYAKTILSLLWVRYLDSEDFETLLEMALRLVPYFKTIVDDEENPEEYSVLFSAVGEALYRYAREYDKHHFFRIALDYFYQAHHLVPENYQTLERIIYILVALREYDAASLVFAEFDELEASGRAKYENSSQLREWYKACVGASTT
jgi:tetratricopeptide (TPR) repeat protein